MSELDIEALAEVAREASDGFTWFPDVIRAVLDATLDERDTAYIAAATPDVTLDLIERVRVAEAKVARVEALIAGIAGTKSRVGQFIAEDLRAALATPETRP